MHIIIYYNSLLGTKVNINVNLFIFSLRENLILKLTSEVRVDHFFSLFLYIYVIDDYNRGNIS